jgi:hypothetical protein
MLRNIHFFNIRPGADEKRMLYILDHDVAEYAMTFGCIERRTLRLLDATSHGQPAQSAAYINESIWPSRKEADAFTYSDPPEDTQRVLRDLLDGIEVEKTVRYVDLS